VAPDCDAYRYDDPEITLRALIASALLVGSVGDTPPCVTASGRRFD
jgi:hypothetical protein